jgi:hypothetical protein
MIAVFTVTDRADSQNNMNIRADSAENGYCLTEIVGTLVNREFLLLEEVCRAFLAVVNNFTRLLEAIDMIGAKREKSRLQG